MVGKPFEETLKCMHATIGLIGNWVLLPTPLPSFNAGGEAVQTISGVLFGA